MTILLLLAIVATTFAISVTVFAVAKAKHGFEDESACRAVQEVAVVNHTAKEDHGLRHKSDVGLHTPLPTT